MLLQWQTANEINVLHFNIQRSVNGYDFISIGKVNASGVSGYSFLDNKLPNTYDKQMLNYRLEIVDRDDSKTYSVVRTLNFKPQSLNGISIYPNPAKYVVNIISKQSIKNIKITNLYGASLQELSFINDNNCQIKTSSLASGIYCLIITLKDGSIQTQKIIIEK